MSDKERSDSRPTGAAPTSPFERIARELNEVAKLVAPTDHQTVEDPLQKAAEALRQASPVTEYETSDLVVHKKQSTLQKLFSTMDLSPLSSGKPLKTGDLDGSELPEETPDQGVLGKAFQSIASFSVDLFTGDLFTSDLESDKSSKDIKSSDIKSADIKTSDIKSDDIKSDDIKSTDIKSTDIDLKSLDLPTPDRKPEPDPTPDQKPEPKPKPKLKPRSLDVSREHFVAHQPVNEAPPKPNRPAVDLFGGLDLSDENASPLNTKDIEALEPEPNPEEEIFKPPSKKK